MRFETGDPEAGADYDITIIKQDYREIFTEANATLLQHCMAMREGFQCAKCPDSTGDDTALTPENTPETTLNRTYHAGCGYRGWQQAVLAYLEQDAARQVLEKLNLIQAYKKQFSCHQCGVCCRFASSEYTYDQLLERAAAGDSFAKQFTSIFLPYASMQEAYNRFPEMVTSVLTQADDPESVTFYHCPYVGEDNRCTIYGSPKRPEICSHYPDTPLTFIYKNCAWRPWKDQTHGEAMWAHAMIELCSWWIGRLKANLEA